MLQKKPQRSSSAKGEPLLQNGMTGLALESSHCNSPKRGAQPTPDPVGVTNLCEMSKMPGKHHNMEQSQTQTLLCSQNPGRTAPGQSKPEALTLLLRAAKRGPKHIPLANLLWQPLPAQHQVLRCSPCLAGLHYCNLGMGISGHGDFCLPLFPLSSLSRAEVGPTHT